MLSGVNAIGLERDARCQEAGILVNRYDSLQKVCQRNDLGGKFFPGCRGLTSNEADRINPGTFGLITYQTFHTRDNVDDHDSKPCQELLGMPLT